MKLGTLKIYQSGPGAPRGASLRSLILWGSWLLVDFWCPPEGPNKPQMNPEMVQNGTETDHLEHSGGLVPEII